MNKTIIMIGNTSWGMLRFRGDLMRKMVLLNYKVIVLSPQDAYSDQFEALGVKFIPIEVDRKGKNPFKDLTYIFRLLRVLLEERPDIVLTYTIKPILYGTLASWIAQVPQRIAITTGLGNTFSSENIINKLVKILYKFFLRLSSEVWFLNSEDAAIFKTHKLVSCKKIFILPGEGVDIHHFTPVEVPKKLTFTLISRMLWDKGIGLFVESAREIKSQFPEAKFYLVGPIDSGNPEAILSSEIDVWVREGIIEFLGLIDDVRTILGKTACLVHPTYYKEGLPRVLLEACSMGVPCVATDIPGCRDVVIDGVNGFLVPPRSSQDLTEAIIKFIALDEDTKNKFSRVSREHVSQNFSSEFINSIYLSKLFL